MGTKLQCILLLLSFSVLFPSGALGAGESSTSMQDVSNWPNKPLYIYADFPHVKTANYGPYESLPLGVPIEFESDLFKGRILIRLRGDDRSTTKAKNLLEDHGHHPLQWMYIVQGHFKKRMKLQDIMSGDFYKRPFKGLPKSKAGRRAMELYQKGMESMFPGFVMDFTSDRPKVLKPFASFCSIRVDRKGEEPELSSSTISVEEDMSLMKEIPRTSNKRKKFLSNPKASTRYSVDPSHVFTFEMHDKHLDLKEYTQTSMMMKTDMCKLLDKQPLSFGLFDVKNEQVIFKFPILHEKLFKSSC
ncbi:hypothetical protein CTEN210_02704 [Chaetoceros tenuissimus]|uniref:Domain of unknown function at the cortex 1 domain-containing protein n=1 Tax=Chaetoceros tenuissimus TaxID=426638 RepID=A0AAD3CKB9_9STRA|nr:hypothetical protein CTEN210_02704 [Chaetoceros tenuissimus]